MHQVVITGAARTAIGGFQGDLSGLTASELGGAALAGVLGSEVPDSVTMGCVLPAGQGQAPARQAGFAAGLSEAVPALTLNKMCGSGMAAIAAAADGIALGRIHHALAGGMESMSNAPYLLPAMRSGARLGHVDAVDHMFLDGLEDAYDKGRLMGTFAEDCADRYGFSREAQDAYAVTSLQRALAAQASGAFADEIVPVEIQSRGGVTAIAQDEQPSRARPDKIPLLKPVFPGWRHRHRRQCIVDLGWGRCGVVGARRWRATCARGSSVSRPMRKRRDGLQRRLSRQRESY